MLRLAGVSLLLVLTACGNSSPGGGDGHHPPPEAITLSIVSPFNVTPAGNSWVVAGSPAFTVLATGAGFTENCVIQWNGSALPTQFGSATGLAATVTSSFIAQPGTATLQVKDTATGVVSNSLPFGIASAAATAAGVAQMITVAPDGSPADGDSLVAPSISSSGRFVSFQSAADNLISGHRSSGYQEIYERDTCIGAPQPCTPSTISVSVTSDGSAVTGHSRISSISGDGRYVAFDSSAGNILPGGSACIGSNCVFLRDTCFGAPAGCTPATTLISVAADGSIANGGSPAISANGRFVAFVSAGVTPTAGPGIGNIFLRDTCNGAPAGCSPSTVLVSATFSGEPSNALSVGQSVSADGRFVAFDSYATNLVPADNSIWPDVFLRDTCLGAPPSCKPQTTRVSVSSSGTEENGAAESNGWQPSISADGRIVAWFSAATNMITQNVPNGVYMRDMCTGAAAQCTPTTSLASVGNDGALPNLGQKNQSMSATGRFIAFGSLASNLVAGDTFPAGAWEDVFVRDTCFAAPAGCTPSTVRVSVANFPGSFATQSDAVNDYPALSADGHFIVFLSAATNYLPSGGNGHTMVYLAKTGF